MNPLPHVPMLTANDALQHTSIDVYAYVNCRMRMPVYQGV